MLKILVKFNAQWQAIDAFSVLDDYHLSSSYFNARDFKSEIESLSFTLKLSGALLNLFLNSAERLPILLEEEGELIFGGLLENVFSSQETCVVGTEDFLRVNFKARAWLAWFDFDLEQTFNPYAELALVEALPVCDPFNPSRSLLHKLWAFLKVPFVLKEDLVLSQKSYSFVIKEKENVLKALQELFWELAHFIYIDAHGVFYAYPIQSHAQEKDIPLLKNCSDFSLIRSQKEGKYLKLEWASVLYKSRAVLQNEKKAIYSEASGILNEKGEMEPLSTLIPQADYPPFSSYHETYQRPSARFLQTNYTWDYVEEGIFGRQSAVNEDLSVIALWDFDLSFKADKGLIKQYFRCKSDSFCFSFVNPLPLKADSSAKDSLLNLYYLDVYASCLYRTQRHYLQNKVAPCQTSSYKESVGTWSEKEVFLRYVNDKQVAQSFFNLHANRLQKAGLSFRFRSLKDLKLNSFYALCRCGQTFYCLITRKTKEKRSVCFSYEAIQNLPLKPLNAHESHHGGSWERPIPLYDYYLASRWSKHKVHIRTNYVDDEELLSRADEQTRVFGGKLIFSSSVFFLSSHVFVSECVCQTSTFVRHRPLGAPSFKKPCDLILRPRQGVIVHSRVAREEEVIKKGKVKTLFKIS